MEENEKKEPKAPEQGKITELPVLPGRSEGK
jgi:hypothetical protein